MLQEVGENSGCEAVKGVAVTNALSRTENRMNRERVKRSGIGGL